MAHFMAQQIGPRLCALVACLILKYQILICSLEWKGISWWIASSHLKVHQDSLEHSYFVYKMVDAV